MIRDFLKNRRLAWSRWWIAPVTRRDRALGALVGSIGGFWIALIGRLVVGPTPLPAASVLPWALLGVVLGLALGIRFPKSVTVVCFPFSTIG